MLLLDKNTVSTYSEVHGMNLKFEYLMNQTAMWDIS
jgi:hypothetical protein